MPVTKSEICNIVKQFDSNKSASYDNVNVPIVKSTINFIIEPIIHICNISLNTGVFPSSMKLAKVIPVFKKGDQNNCNNYRPISVLPIFSKIVEQIVYNRFYSFLSQNNILCSNQYGFRSNYSVQFAPINLHDIF